MLQNIHFCASSVYSMWVNILECIPSWISHCSYHILLDFTYFQNNSVVSLNCLVLQCIRNDDYINALVALSRAISYIPIQIWVCNYGEKVATAFAELHESIYNISWHLCPEKHKKNIVIMLTLAEKPFYFKGIFKLNVSHETFKKVNSNTLKSNKFSPKIGIYLRKYFVDYHHRVLLFHDASTFWLMTERRDKENERSAWNRTSFITANMHLTTVVRRIWQEFWKVHHEKRFCRTAKGTLGFIWLH